MKSGSMGTVEPISGAPALQPNVLFLPLLAFDSSGRRLDMAADFMTGRWVCLGHLALSRPLVSHSQASRFPACQQMR